MNWFLAVLKKYAVLSGRAQRAEYWYFFLFYLLIYIALAIIDNVTGSLSADAEIGLLGSIFVLGTLIPSVAVGVRRLHDTDRSGWWLLLAFVPVVGTIVLIVFMVQDSSPGNNRFGPNPKGATS